MSSWVKCDGCEKYERPEVVQEDMWFVLGELKLPREQGGTKYGPVGMTPEGGFHFCGTYCLTGFSMKLEENEIPNL